MMMPGIIPALALIKQSNASRKYTEYIPTQEQLQIQAQILAETKQVHTAVADLFSRLYLGNEQTPLSKEIPHDEQAIFRTFFPVGENKKRLRHATRQPRF